MPSYVKPAVQIAQEFSKLQTAVQANLPACVIGPNFRLFRISDTEEKALIGLGAYDNSGDTEYDYPSQPAGSTVDLGYTKLYFEDVKAQFAAIPSSATNPVYVVSDKTPNKLRAAPRIGAAEEGKFGSNATDVSANGVFMQTGGYYVGGASLPESYYLWPTGGAEKDIISALNNFNSEGADDATLAFRTTEGHAGSIPVLATDAPLTAGNTVQGPHGIVLDLDAADHNGDRNAEGRVACRVSYVAGTDIAVNDTIVVDGTTFTFKAAAASATQVTIGANHRETFQNLKNVLETAVQAGTLTNVLEVLHITGNAVTAGSLLILANEGLAAVTGTFAGDDPTISTVATHNSLLAPRIITFSGNGSSFTLAVKPSKMQQVIDAAIDSGKRLHLRLNLDGASSVTAAWSSSTYRVTLTGDIGYSTLTDVRAALTDDSDIAALFDIGAIEGDGDDAVDLVADQTGVQITDDFDLPLIRDFYRVRLYANDYTFKTNDAGTVSSHFKSRGVRVGDTVRYQFTGTDSEVYTGETTVRAIEADTTTAELAAATAGDDNTETATGSDIQNGTGLDILEAGADNQRSFDGTGSAVFSLYPTEAYGGRYTLGVLTESYTVTITVTGVAGVAQATVTAANAGTIRTGVRVEEHPSGDETLAVVYLGDGLYAVLDQGGSDGDAEFQAGDTYSFSSDVSAAYTATDPDTLTVSGTYTGTKNTTYRIEVTRGGVFNREAIVTDGVQSGNRAVLTYTGQPTAADTITIDGTVFEFDDNVAIGGDADTTYGSLVTAVNAAGLGVIAVQDLTDGTVTVSGPYAVINGMSESADNVTLVKQTARITASVDWDALGDVDDEYILRCTQSGSLTNAAFSLTSLRGDNATSVQFSGSGVAQTVGTQGMSLTLTGANDPTLQVGDTYIVRLFGSRPLVSITDSAGVDERTTATVSDGEAVALGLLGGSITFEDNTNTHGGLTSTGGLVKGETFYVEAVASGEGPNKVLVLRDPIPLDALTPGRTVDNQDNATTADDWTYNYAPTRLAVWLDLAQTRTLIPAKRLQEAGEYNYEATVDGVTVNADIEVQDASWVDNDGTLPYLPVQSANAYLEYRALIPGDGVYSLADASGVAAALGDIDVDNPLAFGVNIALLNSASQPVVYVAITSNDLAGYNAALALIAKKTGVYTITPLSRDSSVLAAVQAHTAALSTETTRKWRIGTVSADVPAVVSALDSSLNSDADFTATITRYVADAAGVYRLVTVTNGTPNLLSRVSAGDTVRYAYGTDAWGDAEYTEGVVAEVLTNTTLLLVAGPASAINVAAKIEVTHPRTAAELATAVAATSAAFDDYRMYNVYPNTLYSNGTAVGGEFAAAAVSGLISAVAPQQGLTNAALVGFDDVPATYQVFTDDQLNEMAASGTLIVAQDERAGPIYVRHQLSTKALDNNVLTSELSVIKNLDAISAYFRDLLQGYIGVYNVSDELLTVLQTQIQHGLNFLGSSRTAVGLLSPMLLLDNGNTRIVSLEQHPVNRDWIVARVELEMPLPVNVIQLTLVAG